MQTALLNEPRTYRYSTVRLVLLILLLVLLGTVPFMILGSTQSVYILISWTFIGLIMAIAIYSLTRSTTISDDGISSRTLFGERSLNWSEIDSVSGRGNGIKLHSRDGDTVAPSPQLPGYPEVIEIIGAKRPDLFNPTGGRAMSRNWFGSLLFLVIGAVSVGAGIYLYFDPSETESLMPLIFLAVVALAFVISIFTSVLALNFEGPALTVRYLVGRTTLKPDEIRSVVFGVTQTRNGKSYNVHIFTTRGRTISFSGIGPSLPIVYLVLKNWQQGRAK
jgi:PH (Pleckstrin Homology) domain-containing protein